MANKKQAKGKAPAQAQVQTRSVGMRVLACVLALVLIAAAALMVLQFCTPWKPSGWFGKKKGFPEPTGKAGPSAFIMDDAAEGDGIMLLSTPIAKSDFEAFAIDENADSAKLLTVQFTPAGTNMRTVTWTIRFENAASEWASGKTLSDYVTLNVASNTTEAATVTCLQPFGEPVIVEARALGNDGHVEISASMTGHYVKAVTNVLVGFDKGPVIRLGVNEVYQVTLDAEYGVGTLEPKLMTVGGGVCRLVLSTAAQTALKEALHYEHEGSLPAYDLNVGAPSITSENYLYYAIYGQHAGTPNAAKLSELKSAFVGCGNALSSMAAMLQVEVAAVYNGVVVSQNVYERVGLSFDVTTLRVYPTSMEIVGDPLIWGI